ncbi:MAG: Succinyl-CoA:3-ketoacid-coenzyme A transferase subunit A (EC [uncultured Caballeronia sp.]|nr:MAG: Succinyl-CoA:3-ketoacid-coenzyme A transferase subunit A (EC [uncultured Caballeronia sp.]
MNKVYPSAKEVLDGIVKDGQTFAVGGFGLCGIPEALIAALRDTGVCRASRASATTRVSTASDSGFYSKPVGSRK